MVGAEDRAVPVPQHYSQLPALTDARSVTGPLFTPAGQAQQQHCQVDVGGASAGGIIAVILANIVAVFLMRMIGRNLEA